MYNAQTLSAGVAVEFQEAATFFRLLAAPAVDITIYFYRNGAEIGRVQNVGAGYAERFDTAFDRLRISSVGGGAIAYVTKMGGDVKYDTPPNGNVTVTNTSGSVTNTQKTVTSTSAQLIAAKAARRYLLIQNKDAAGIVYINFGAGAATAANGLKIPAGGSYSADANYCPNDAIQAISDIASNANIVVIEG